MQENRVLSQVVDAIDIETVVICDSELQAKEYGWALLKQLGLEGDIVGVQFTGSAARLRLRGNIYLPGDRYHWDKKIT